MTFVDPGSPALSLSHTGATAAAAAGAMPRAELKRALDGAKRARRAAEAERDRCTEAAAERDAIAAEHADALRALEVSALPPLYFCAAPVTCPACERNAATAVV
jgi:hypothetical protein